jgi:hypothetical protein
MKNHEKSKKLEQIRTNPKKSEQIQKNQNKSKKSKNVMCEPTHDFSNYMGLHEKT